MSLLFLVYTYLGTNPFDRGCILIIGIGIITTCSGYVLGQFKIQYPQVHNMSDAAEILFGSVGREVVTIAQITFFIFLWALIS